MRIVVLAGGLSMERNVSLSSGNKICRALRARGHQAILVDMFMGFEDYDGKLEDVFDAPNGFCGDYSVAEAEPDLAAVRASRKDQSKSLFGPGVLDVCAKADIAAHNFDKITSLCKEARKTALGFEIAHVGVNAGDAEESLAVCRALDAAFGFGVKEGNSSNFAGSGVEVMKSPYLGKNDHIAVKTNSIPRAAAELAKNGFTLDESTAKYKGEKMVAVYLKQEFGGFAVHLLQK